MQSERFTAAIVAFDAINREDPNFVEFEGEPIPRCLLDARRASAWTEALDADASEPLRLAVRAHHLGRFQHPRSEFPVGRAGYHAWRRALQKRHAETATQILHEVGYSDAETERVAGLICKRGLGRDAEVQTLEDALCLVFIETALVPFAKKHEEERVIEILVTSLGKMSDAGRTLIPRIQLPESETQLVAEAARRFSQRSEGP